MLLEYGTVILILAWYVYKEVDILIKEELMSIVMDSGEQYVQMDLILMMPKLFVDNWDIQDM